MFVVALRSDEGGLNCIEGQDLPDTCPVGCAVVFPEFLEACRDHIQIEDSLEEADFELFETECFDQDGIALVEYAIMLQNTGCILTFGAPAGPGGGH